MRITSGYLLVSWPVQALVDNIQSSFQEFMMKYNKVYDSLEDYKIALNAFAENIKEMEELKANSDIEHEVGLNEYFDMPKEVFKQTMPCRAAPPISNSSKPARFQVRHLFSDPPPSIDWQAAGALGPVRKQSTFFNKCGCCYAMASTGKCDE
ncbi:hypothetical protein FOL47_003605 [Perkinsus chesapeaki]|uniref:Cathepsin propeptide inhibitor domain-containing protein n=1 Tax=Perkinsus chesapeaki TaxID=330153 RepID=A0A7J6M7F2_PERCH|nr:hypothetical protein FOL47_003605 [Perkinsus chesapeaki]